MRTWLRSAPREDSISSIVSSGRASPCPRVALSLLSSEGAACVAGAGAEVGAADPEVWEPEDPAFRAVSLLHWIAPPDVPADPMSGAPELPAKKVWSDRSGPKKSCPSSLPKKGSFTLAVAAFFGGSTVFIIRSILRPASRWLPGSRVWSSRRVRQQKIHSALFARYCLWT